MYIIYKFRILFLISVCVLFQFPVWTVAANTTPDSLLTEKQIHKVYYSAPDSALRLLDEAEARHLPDMPLFRIDILRGMVYESQGMYTLKAQYIQRALQNDSVQKVPWRKLQVLVRLATTLDRLNKYGEGISVTTEALALAQQLKQKGAESELLFTLGRMHRGMMNLSEGYNYMLRSIKLLEETNDVREMARLSTSYGDLSSFYDKDGQNEEAIRISKLRTALIQRMSGMPGPPPGYIDQQYGYLYSKLAYYYQKAGHPQEAAEAYNRFRSTQFAQQPMGVNEIVPYLLLSGQYEKALECNNQWKQLFASRDSVGYDYLVLLDRYACIYRGLKKPVLADSYQLRATVLTDSIYSREKQSQAQEFAVIYQTKEKDMQLQEKGAKLMRQRIYFAAACLVAILFALLLWEKQTNLRKTRQRNRIAARQIDELLVQREELRRAYAGTEKVGGETKDKGNEKARVEANKETPGQVDKNIKNREAEKTDKLEDEEVEFTVSRKRQEELSEESRHRFINMENALLTDQLFLSPKLNRDDLMRLSGLSKNRLSSFIQECAGTNVSGYINRLRVEYSISLLRQLDAYSIDAIAPLAGFNSRSAYYTAFSRVFGMTPMQYRETLKEEV